jgi:hypothetical protein
LLVKGYFNNRTVHLFHTSKHRPKSEIRKRGCIEDDLRTRYALWLDVQCARRNHRVKVFRLNE